MTPRDDITTVYVARSSEIQWRAVQRDALVLFAFLLTGTMAGMGAALFTPVLLYFVAVMWHRHDKRIGAGARFLRIKIEPLMVGVPSYEQWLDSAESERSYVKKATRSAVSSRLFFPTMQLGGLGWGVVRYMIGHRTTVATVGVVALTVVELALIVFTFITVKHERSK